MPSSAGRLRDAVLAGPARVVAEPHACREGTHTRLGDGRRLCWVPTELAPGTRYAVDAELADQPVPRALGRGLTPERFWWLWTRAEARAKLADVPIAVWLRTVDWRADGDVDADEDVGIDADPDAGVDVPAVAAATLYTTRTADLVVTYAVAPPLTCPG